MKKSDSPNWPDITPLLSPCIGVCQLHPDTGLCTGCLRTIDEIAGWSGASEEAKRSIWEQIRQRQADSA